MGSGVTDLREKVGLCQWFHYQDYESVEATLRLLQELGVRHLRTGISWADYLRPEGKRWYDWQMAALDELDVLLSVWHTPPSLAEGGTCAGPPVRLQDYADFLDLVISDYGHHFSYLEIWNEPNNRYKWDFPRYDTDWSKFATMVGMAAHWARRRGKPTVLGGMIPVDPAWLALIDGHGAMEDIDIVAIHGFPGMWWPGAPNWDWYHHWDGWDEKIASIRPQAGDRPIWITEAGLATWDMETEQEARFDLQCQMLEQAVAAPVDKLYWYSLIDLDPRREAIEGYHVDENEYHMGLVQVDGTRKPAFDRLKDLLR